MDVGFCVPASPPNPSRGRPSCISAALLCILAPRKTRLNRGDLGPTPGMVAGRKMGWHKRRISGMGPSGKLGPPKITHAKGRCVFVCPQLGLQFAVGGTLSLCSSSCNMSFRGGVLHLSTYYVHTHTKTHTQKGRAPGDPARLISHKRE